MLAQNFLTAEYLGISEKEQAALIKVLGMLERGELFHVPEVEPMGWYDAGLKRPKFSGAFNMDNIFTTHPCGTAACLAGTADIVCGTAFAPNGDPVEWPDALNDLFCPPSVVDWQSITPADAAIALRNYLTLGEAGWAEVLRHAG
jgi:hypothetical protein